MKNVLCWFADLSSVGGCWIGFLVVRCLVLLENWVSRVEVWSREAVGSFTPNR